MNPQQARERDGKDAALVAVVAASYGVTLFAFGSHRSGDDFADLKRVIQILGLFGVILLAVLCWFTFLTGKRSRAAG